MGPHAQPGTCIPEQWAMELPPVRGNIAVPTSEQISLWRMSLRSSVLEYASWKNDVVSIKETSLLMHLMESDLKFILWWMKSRWGRVLSYDSMLLVQVQWRENQNKTKPIFLRLKPIFQGVYIRVWRFRAWRDGQDVLMRSLYRKGHFCSHMLINVV